MGDERSPESRTDQLATVGGMDRQLATVGGMDRQVDTTRKCWTCMTPTDAHFRSHRNPATPP
jgi:hypothetical protein